MSTTDTIRAAFEAAYLSANGFHTKAELATEWKDGMLSSHMFRAGWQAATEAAKATGTAGELPPLPSHPEVQVMRWSELEQKAIREYGQACAEAARHDKDGNHADDLRGMLDELQAQYDQQEAAFMACSAKLQHAEQELAARQPAPVVAMQHPDDIAVDKFAVAMKDKMAVSRTKGRGGWENPEECGIEDLACMLVQHVEKGDPVDIGNFCMMVWNRVRDTGPDTYAPIVEAFLSYAGDAAKPAPATLPPVVGVSRDADSPGMTGVLVTFARPLSDGQLRELHEYLNRSQP